jgi:hypothetical protein
MYFEIVGEIRDIEVIAIGGNIDDIMRLRRQFGPGRWRKLKALPGCAWSTATCAGPSCTGTKPTASAERR